MKQMDTTVEHVPCTYPHGSGKIAFVGEAPSTEELVFRKPFVGPAGRVFNQMMRSANLDRDNYLITNAYDQMLEDDEPIETFMRDEELTRLNAERLKEELEHVKPNVIVPMGNTALWMFTGQTLISKYRGATTTASRIVPGAKLLPTYHPSAIQRSWKLLPLAVGDLMRAAEESRYPNIRYPHVELLIEPTLEDVRRFCEECRECQKLSVDIETGWGQITSIALAPTPQRAMAIPFVDLRKPNKCYWGSASDELLAWRFVQGALETGVPKVGQNLMYDLFWLYDKKGIKILNYRHDTRLKHKVLFPELPADLGTMAATYTKVGSYKTWGGRYQKDTEKRDG